MELKYRLFILFVLLCVSIFLTIIYNNEREDQKTQETTSNLKAYYCSMILFWLIFFMSSIFMLLPYTGERSSLSAIPTGQKGLPLTAIDRGEKGVLQADMNRIIQAGDVSGVAPLPGAARLSAEGDVQMAQAVPT